MTTRSKSEALLSHLLDNVLVQKSDSDLQKALKHEVIKTFLDLMGIKRSVIETLTYSGKDGKSVIIHRYNHSIICALKSFIHYNQYIGTT